MGTLRLQAVATTFAPYSNQFCRPSAARLKPLGSGLDSATGHSNTGGPKCYARVR